MITGITIENFKGIREPIRIGIKPITLLFGPNSAGKSTIIQAIHYAREVIERHNLNADQTIAGGKFVDMGGFRNFVHGRDMDRSIRLRFEIDLSEDELPTYITHGGRLSASEYEFPELSVAVHSATVAASVGWSESREALYVSDYSVDINGLPLAKIDCSSDMRNVHLTEINYRHPILPQSQTLEEIAQQADEEAKATSSRAPFRFSWWAIENQQDALPVWGRALPLVTPDLNEHFDESIGIEGYIDTLVAILSQLIVGPGELLRDHLQSFRYLGPIRETPPRGYLPPKSPDASRWASGLAAWDSLANGTEVFVQKVSDWLAGPERLNTHYRVELRKHKKLDLADPLVRSLLSGRAFDEADRTRLDLQKVPTETQVVLVSEDNQLDLLPSDVGIGISQILPVVVASTGDRDRLVLIEQPELHVHPRIQAELGDLFIETSVDGPHEYLIETHSEHLILRILRRIRETSKGKPHNGVAVTGEHVAVYYVNVENEETRLRRIDIDKKGEFVQPWPDDFFEIDFYERFA